MGLTNLKKENKDTRIVAKYYRERKKQKEIELVLRLNEAKTTNEELRRKVKILNELLDNLKNEFCKTIL
jgi:hypothetical protein